MALFNCRRDDLARYSPLHSLWVMIGGVGPQLELQIAPVPQAADELVTELLPAVNNRVGRLLLPMETSEHKLNMLTLHRDVPALVVYDAFGRVHLILADDCLFIILMKMWDAPRLTTTTVELDSVSHEQHRLLTRDREITVPLRLPENTPEQFQAWRASGAYEVEFDPLGRVFSVHRHDTDIKLGALWDTRFY